MMSARHIVRSLASVLLVAVLGASGTALPAQAADEPPEPGTLRSEPASGPAPRGGEANAGWATFIGDGPCPSGTTHARAFVTGVDDAFFNGNFSQPTPVQEGADARAASALSWTAMRNVADFAASTSHILVLKCGTADLTLEQWLAAPVVYQGLLNYTNDPVNPTWEVLSTGAATPTTVTVAAFADGQATELVTVGTDVEVRATMQPSAAVGDVELFNTNTDAQPDSLGTAAVGGGVATFALDDLAAGEYTLAARFTPDDPGEFAPSQLSAVIPLTVLAGEAEDTTTTLTVSPESPVASGAEVTLTATVEPSEAAGRVQFTVSGEALGEPVAVAAGTAELVTTELPDGDLTLTASFRPADQAAFAGSTSTPVSYTVGDGPQVTAVDADGEPLGANPTLEEGQVVTLTAPAFQAEEEVTVTLDPDGEAPEELGTTAAAADGVVTTRFTASNVEPGQHRLDFAGASQTLTWRFQLAGDAGHDDGSGDDGGDGGTAAGDDDAGGPAGDGGTGGTDGSGGAGPGDLAETGAFLVGPAVLAGLAAVSAGYAFIRRSRRDELLSFDDVAPGR